MVEATPWAVKTGKWREESEGKADAGVVDGMQKRNKRKKVKRVIVSKGNGGRKRDGDKIYRRLVLNPDDEEV